MSEIGNVPRVFLGRQIGRFRGGGRGGRLRMKTYGSNSSSSSSSSSCCCSGGGGGGGGGCGGGSAGSGAPAASCLASALGLGGSAVAAPPPPPKMVNIGEKMSRSPRFSAAGGGCGCSLPSGDVSPGAAGEAAAAPGVPGARRGLCVMKPEASPPLDARGASTGEGDVQRRLIKLVKVPPPALPAAALLLPAPPGGVARAGTGGGTAHAASPSLLSGSSILGGAAGGA
mmetsp:Transcript_11374/g.35978  ORF Transcript_11374/g.35978 Transcript_11374/m.35978 type:complete len:228 (+) Transcript_11374:882-1565(+)